MSAAADASTAAATPAVNDLVRRAYDALTGSGVISPAADAAALAALACGFERRELATRLSDPATPAAVARLDAFAARRARREPLQLIVGNAPFLELELKVKPGVFIPRPETEGLALAAAELATAFAAPTILDLFAGVGPLAVYLARAAAPARVIAVEQDPAAAALALANAGAYGAAVEVVVADVGDAAAGGLPRAELVVANPPYIRTSALAALPPEVRNWEPARALDGGADGLAYYRAIADLARDLMKPGGALATEVDESAGEAVASLFREAGKVEVRSDLAGRARYVIVEGYE